ncbi:MAG: magnesium-translocating P-type ATPase [Candidatus Omnitrophica bacterium]|nr:magnesium-translocating P-type ATPase [Candidatus Omnitrophota bacterium]MDE2230655.1 magnesium-translocating P-type ATPase [Candidatus Omnitrophota bacterium]
MNGKQKSQVLDFDFKTCPKEVLFEKFQTSATGLSESQAKERLDEYGPNEAARKQKRTIVFQFISKFFHPLVVLLIVIAAVTFWTGDAVSGSIIGLMALMSVVLGFVQEYRAGKEAERLSEMVRATATIFRNGKPKEIPIKHIVPGDIVDLFAGDMIPADIRIIQAKDLFINQASLTGESMPVEKTPVTDSVAFMGSSVVSGTALGVVIKTGLSTEFGEVSKRLAAINQPTSFDKGINSFVWLMIRAMVVLVIVICAINFFTKHNFMDALLFSLSVAIGLTPEMLPMLVAINLSKGAIAMSKKEVIVKRLNSIQNFGAMDVLCTDKTGTLTLDRIVLEKYCDVVRQEDEGTLKLAYINSFYQTGLKNILDKAVLKYEKLVVKQYKKIDEMPFDFSRRIMSVVVDMEGKHKIITKGAPEEILKRCTRYELEGEIEELDPVVITDLKEEYDHLSADGFRVLAIAYKDMDVNKEVYSKDDESSLVLKGYIAFLDPPKPTAKKTIEVIRKLGIELKVLTGDNDLVTKKICSEVGLDIKGLLTGIQLEKMTDDQLKDAVQTTTVFARLSPLQKERVIRALHRNNHTVGYLGDGINDAPALKAADVGISVNNAVDIAKESADLILLQKNLMVLRDGVLEGRRVFGNIFKYIKMGASSNFGNMFSMTGSGFFLPYVLKCNFYPMLPIQIILNNFLYDVSQVAIPTDDVDEEYLLKSRVWNMDYIKKFMIVFGPLSSIFDYLTWIVMVLVFHAGQGLFATAWFVESMCTQLLVIHIIRTGKIPFVESWPSPFLIFTSIYIVSAAMVIPYTPLGAYFKFVMPPASFFLFLFGILALYLWLVQVTKVWFIKKYGYE